MSDLLELLRSRRTAHEYRPDPVPADALEEALQAAVAAPNHRLTEPWRFRRIGPQTRAALLAIYLDIKMPGESAGDEAREHRLRGKFMSAPELLVVSRLRHDDHVIAREDYAAVACAVQNFMLALHARGIGSKWTTGAVTRDPRTYDALDIDFDAERIEGFVWAGYAADAGKPARDLDPAELLRELP